MTKRPKSADAKDYPADVDDPRSPLERLSDLARRVLKAGRPVEPAKGGTGHDDPPSESIKT